MKPVNWTHSVVKLDILLVILFKSPCKELDISTYDNADVPKLTFATANLLLLFITSCFVEPKLDMLLCIDVIVVELVEL